MKLPSPSLHRKFVYSSLFIISFAFLLFNASLLLNIDYGYWAKQTFTYAEILKSGNYFPDFILSHPAVTVLNLGGFSFLIKNIFTPPLVFDYAGLMFPFKLPFLLAFSFFIPYLFFLLKKNGFSPVFSYLSALLVSLNFLVWTANAADILYSIFLIASFFNFLAYLRSGEKEKGHFFLSAVFAALSVLSRFNGAVLVIVIPALMLCYRKNLRYSLAEYAKKILTWFLLLLISLFILWPKFFIKNQVSTITEANIGTLTFSGNNLLSGNSSYSQRIVSTAVDLPLLQIFFVSCFILFMAVTFLKREKNRKLIIIILSVLLFILFSSLVIDKNIWSYRYALPSFLLLDIIVAYEIWRQFSYILSVKKYRKLFFPYLSVIILLFLYEYYYYTHLL